MKVLTTQQAEKVMEDLDRRGLYSINKQVLEALKQLQQKYDTETSLEQVREITYKVWKKHKKTLSDEVRYIRRGEQ